MRKAVAALLLGMLPGAGHAADDLHARALAAGYRSAFLCSDLFTAGLSEAEAAENDLEGIYPEYQALVRALPAAIDRQRHTVSVTYAPDLPPRIAAWRPGLGCTGLPIGAGIASAAVLPRLTAVPAPGTADARPWPDGDAGTSAPAPAGLAAVVARAFDGQTYGAGTRTSAVLVVQDGRIVAERYADGVGPHVPQRTWSVGKSITATLVGRAVQLGLVRLDAPATIPEWRAAGDPRRTITLAQLLHMTSGLWTNGPGNRTDEVYLGGAAVTQWVTAQPLETPPGTRFRYSNDDALLAARAVRAALGDGQAALDFPYDRLFRRIGMAHTVAETDWQGSYMYMTFPPCFSRSSSWPRTSWLRLATRDSQSMPAALAAMKSPVSCSTSSTMSHTISEERSTDARSSSRCSGMVDPIDTRSAPAASQSPDRIGVSSRERAAAITSDRSRTACSGRSAAVTGMPSSSVSASARAWRLAGLGL